MKERDRKFYDWAECHGYRITDIDELAAAWNLYNKEDEAPTFSNSLKVDEELIFHNEKTIKHQMLCNELHNTYVQKNAAYGDSFGKSFEEWGISAAAIRITDKFNRFINLAKHPEIDKGDESIKDTLVDLANYALMAVLELER